MRAPKKSKSVKVLSCELCGHSQAEFGAILYGPPEYQHGRNVVEKTHMCVVCYDDIFRAADKH
jgi:hypothetical protein